jgi:hypothetical protein
MKVTTITNTIVLFIALLGIGMAPTTQAQHATNFLDALQADVEARLAAVDENTPAEERRALTSASRTLSRNSRTLSADLGLLANASTALSAGFPEDAVFDAEQEAALSAYAGEAQLQLDTTAALAGTNALPRNISNQLAQAQAAIDRGNDGSNSVPVRARSIAFALNKIRVATLQTLRVFKAPLSIDDNINLNGRGGQSVTLESTGTYTIPGEEGDETGTWSYERTTNKTGTVTLTPLVGEPRTIQLTFKSSSRGTFRGTNAAGEPFNGSFTVTEPEPVAPAE